MSIITKSKVPQVPPSSHIIGSTDILLTLCLQRDVYDDTDFWNYILIDIRYVPLEEWILPQHIEKSAEPRNAPQAFAFTSDACAWAMASRIEVWMSFPAAITPKFSPNVLPTPKSSGCPLESVTIPPASSTMRDPGAWSYTVCVSPNVGTSKFTAYTHPDLLSVADTSWHSHIRPAISTGQAAVLGLTVHADWGQSDTQNGGDLLIRRLGGVGCFYRLEESQFRCGIVGHR